MDELPLREQVLATFHQKLNNITKNRDADFRQRYERQAYNEENTGLPSWNDINHTHMTSMNSIKQLEDFLNDKDLLEENYDPRKFVVRTEPGQRRKILQETHVFPSGKFPVETGGLMEILLRKRLDPQVEAWMEKERKEGERMEDGEGGMRSEDWMGLWNWAAMEGQMALQKVFIDGVEEADDDEDEDKDMEDDLDGGGGLSGGKGKEAGNSSVPMMPIDQVLAYMTSGYRPKAG